MTVLNKICKICLKKAMKAVCKTYELILVTILLTGLCYVLCEWLIFDRAGEAIRRYVENKLVESLKFDKGVGCDIPQLNPFSKDVFNPYDIVHPIDCSENGPDWVKCYHSECRIVDEIKITMKDISCHFSDILYKNDLVYEIGPKTAVRDGVYRLRQSDHVKVSCTGINVTTGRRQKWIGNALGLRPVEPKAPPPGRERTYNVLILGFHSMPKNGFIRRMPLSYQVLTEELRATVLHAFHVTGAGTSSTLFPLLTGKSELELLDMPKSLNSTNTLDSFPFIFGKLNEDGYRTAYFEDMTDISSFQLNYNGSRQPTDHYLRAFFLEDNERRNLLRRPMDEHNCIGDTQQFKLMMNLTQQFMELGGKWFAFTFIADITRKGFDSVQAADADMAAFLRHYWHYAEDTLLVVLGDHGPRYSAARETLQGKLEERLPLLAIRLPNALVRERPEAAARLGTQMTLTTPHDLHATILDVLGMKEYWNPYKVKGADLPRALTMLRQIPPTRSCSEAGVAPHWCACSLWELLSPGDPLYAGAAHALLRHINDAVRDVGRLCAERTMASEGPVARQRHKRDLIPFPDPFEPPFTPYNQAHHQILQVKIVTSPGRGVFEATIRHETKTGKFLIDLKDVSRITPYENESHCVIKTHPHLSQFCYCKVKFFRSNV